MKTVAISSPRNNILVIDSSGQTLAVAINGRALVWPQDRTSGDRLLVTIDQLLHQAGVSPTKIAGVVLVAGPGSFTGLRIGATIANGIGFANKVGVLGVSLFEVIHKARLKPKLDLVVLDAGRGELFVEGTNQPPRLIGIATLSKLIRTGERVYIDTPELVAKVHAQLKTAGTIVLGPVGVEERLAVMAGMKIPKTYKQVLPSYLREANITLKPRARIKA